LATFHGQCHHLGPLSRVLATPGAPSPRSGAAAQQHGAHDLSWSAAVRVSKAQSGGSLAEIAIFWVVFEGDFNQPTSSNQPEWEYNTLYDSSHAHAP